MLDREDIVNERDYVSSEETALAEAITDSAFEYVIKAARRKAGEYEANKLFTAASALKQFANELEQS